MIQSATLYVLLVLASAEDLRIREVPFLLSGSTVIAGVAFSALNAVQAGSYVPLLHGVLGGVIAYGVGYALFYAGQWGGGDVALLTGVATFIGFDPAAPAAFTSYVLLVFLAGSVYGVAWSVYRVARNADDVLAALPSRSPVLAAAGFSGVFFAAALVASVTHGAAVMVMLAALGFLGLSSMVVYVYHHAEDALTKRWKDPSGLVPGDWLVEPVETGDGVVEASSTGLSVEDIHRLRDGFDGRVAVREGLPFVPSFFFAYLVFDTVSFASLIQILV